MSSNLSKRDWRVKARQLIKEHALDVSLGHVSRVLDSQEFRDAGIIALYFSVSTEPNTMPIMDAAFALGKRIAVPIYNQATQAYDWAEYLPKAEVVEARYCIVEPKNAPRIEPSKIDVCFLPGLLFDRKGVRLGHGGGYYDRLLAQLPSATPIIGLAFPWQIVNQLPSEPHDIVCTKVLFE